ncbi:MAG: hypothetical protein AAF958_18310, partial [Planctomycetota bacterium]
LEDTVRGIWDANALFVSFGARGSGFGVSADDAFFDNFAVEAGRIVAVPEAHGIALLVMGMTCLVARRRR